MKEKKYYVGATQNAVIRLDKSTPEEVLGLYTDQLKICLGIVLYGQEGQISLMHYDGTIGKQEMQSEFQKIHELQKWEIWRNSSKDWNKKSGEHRDEFKKLVADEKWTNIEPTLRLTENGSFCIALDNGMGLPRELYSPNVKFIDYKELRHSISMLNHLFGDEDIDEQYNGKQWSNVTQKLRDNVSLKESKVAIDFHENKDKLLLENPSYLYNQEQKANIANHWQEKVDDYLKYHTEPLGINTDNSD